MYRSDVRTRLEGSLDPSPSPTAGPGNRLAAVLLPLVEDRLVLTRRTEHLSRHRARSRSRVVSRRTRTRTWRRRPCARRRRSSVPPEEVELLGALAPVHTFVSSILIVPFVGLVSGDPVFAPSEAEIAEVLAYPLDELVGGRDHGGVAEGRARVPWVRVQDERREHGLGRDGRDPAPAARTAREPNVTADDTYVPSDQELRSILGDARTIAVIGLSTNPERPSYEVAEFLQSKGYRIVPVTRTRPRCSANARARRCSRYPRSSRSTSSTCSAVRSTHPRSPSRRGARREGAVVAGRHLERRRAQDRRGRRPDGRHGRLHQEAGAETREGFVMQKWEYFVAPLLEHNPGES